MVMAAEAVQTVQSMVIKKHVQIAAPAEIVFATLLAPPGKFGEMNLKMEAWPGGRWYRDLGNNKGHFWGHVQVIKPPTLLEICGPLMMSYAATSHLQYRLTPEAGGTLLTMTHQAIGLLVPEHVSNFEKGWDEILDGIRTGAEGKK